MSMVCTKEFELRAKSFARRLRSEFFERRPTNASRKLHSEFYFCTACEWQFERHASFAEGNLNVTRARRAKEMLNAFEITAHERTALESDSARTLRQRAETRAVLKCKPFEMRSLSASFALRLRRLWSRGFGFAASASGLQPRGFSFAASASASRLRPRCFRFKASD